MSSCQELVKKNEFDTSVLNSNPIEFLNSELFLPPNYEKHSYEELFEIAKNEDNDVINYLLQSAKDYRTEDIKPIFFLDRMSPKNCIALYPMPYYMMDKQTASSWISGMAGSLQSVDEVRGTNTEILEKQIKKFGGGHQMIKFRAKQSNFLSEQTSYFSQYYVTGKQKSFNVISIDVYGQDIEENLKVLALKIH